jgi:hypothetical protein
MLKNFEVPTLVVLAPALAVHEVLQLGFLAAKGEIVAWVRGVVGLFKMLPVLGSDRAAVSARRTVRDRDVLTGGPVMVRGDMVGSGIGAAMKHAYDAWLSAYWNIARRLLPSRPPR